MTCWRFRLRRRLLPYVEGSLDVRATEKVEMHLLDCAHCRALVVRLRAAHAFAQQLTLLAVDVEGAPSTASGPDVNSWRPETRTTDFSHFGRRSAAAILAGTAVVAGAFWIQSVRGRRNLAPHAAIDPGSFPTVSIGDLKNNARPRVSTEGYVSDVHLDREEGTLAFKLAERPGAGEPFVVCEISSPVALEPPISGSYVRVYGVERYDGQPGRHWYEVNPVFEVAVLRR